MTDEMVEFLRGVSSDWDIHCYTDDSGAIRMGLTPQQFADFVDLAVLSSRLED